MPKLHSVIILLNLFLVTGHDLIQKFNTENECTKDIVSDKIGVVEETDHRHERNRIDDRINDKVNIDHIQHSKHYQKENHKYDHNNFNWIYGNPSEVNGITFVNVTGVKNGDVKHGKVMEWNRFDPDIMNHPGEYKILDHNGQETGDVKVEYTVNGKPWNPDTGDLGFFLPEVKLGLDDSPGIDINSKRENTEDMKYKTMPIWPGGNIENKYEYPLPTHYYVEELKKRKKERLAKKLSKKIYNRENIVTVHDKHGSNSISKHLKHSGDWSNRNHDEINGVKIVNVTGVKNGDVKHGKVLEWNGVGPLIINDPGEYITLDQNGREIGSLKIHSVSRIPWKSWDPNEDNHKVTVYADTNKEGKKRIFADKIYE